MLRAAVGVLLCAVAATGSVWADEPVDRVAKLIRELKDDDVQTRRVAAWELRKLGRAAGQAEADLVEALRDREEFVRSNAAIAVLRIGGDPRTVRPLLSDREKSVRLIVAEALLAVHGDVASAAPVLLELRALSNLDFSSRADADGVLHALSPKLARQMQSFVVDAVRTKQIDDSVLQSLPDLGPLDDALVPQLVELLKERPPLRVEAAMLLMKIGPGAKEAVSVLRELAQDRDMRLALTATAALAAIVPQNDEYIRHLSAALVADDCKQRALAQALMHELGPHGAGAAAALVTAMTDETFQPSDSFRRKCGETLQNIGKAAVPEVVKALGRRLGDESLSAVLQTLQMLGHDAEPARSALITLLSDSGIEIAIRVEAINAISGIGPGAKLGAKSAAPTLRLELDSDSASVRAAAATSLGKTGPHGHEVRLRLRLMLRDADADVRLMSGLALLTLDEDPNVVFPTLVELIDESDPHVCMRTLDALQSLGPGAAPAIPKLVKALAFEGGVFTPLIGGSQLSTVAASCLSAVGAPAVPDLILALENQDARSRAFAAEALENIGPPAKSAVAGLRAVLEDDRKVMSNRGRKQTVGQRAMMALGRIGPAARSAVSDLVAILERESARQETLESEELALAVRALGGIGPSASAAVPQLKELLRRDDLELRTRATVLTALARIAAESSALIPGFRRFFTEIQDDGASDGKYLSEFSEATGAIVQMRKHGRTLLPDLTALCECNVLCYWYRCDAASAALRIDPDNVPALRYLHWASKHGYWLLRDCAKEKLDELRQPANSPE